MRSHQRHWLQCYPGVEKRYLAGLIRPPKWVRLPPPELGGRKKINMEVILDWLVPQLVTVIIASITSALTVVVLLSSVFSRLAAIETSLLGTKGVDKQLTEMKVAFDLQVATLKRSLVDVEIDRKARLDAVDSQLKMLSEGAVKDSETLKWIQQLLGQDHEKTESILRTISDLSRQVATLQATASSPAKAKRSPRTPK